MNRLVTLAVLVTALASAACAQAPNPPLPGNERVDVEVAYVKFFSSDPEALEKRFTGKLAEVIKGTKVSDKEWYPRWKRHKIAYNWIPGGTVGVKRHVVNEIKVGKLLAALAAKVTPETDLAAVAKKNGLTFHRYKNATRKDLQLQKDVGSPRAMMMIWSSLKAHKAGNFKLGTIVPYVTRSTGRYWAGCFDEPGNFMAIYRLIRVHESKKK